MRESSLHVNREAGAIGKHRHYCVLLATWSYQLQRFGVSISGIQGKFVDLRVRNAKNSQLGVCVYSLGACIETDRGTWRPHLAKPAVVVIVNLSTERPKVKCRHYCACDPSETVMSTCSSSGWEVSMSAGTRPVLT